MSTFHCIEVNDTVLLSAAGRWEDGRVQVSGLKELLLPPGMDCKAGVASLLSIPSNWVGASVRPGTVRLKIGGNIAELGQWMEKDELGAHAGSCGESLIDSTGSTGLMLACRASALEHTLQQVRKGPVDLNEIVAATFTSISGVARCIRTSEDRGERVMIWDASTEESRLLLVGEEGISLCIPVPFGLDRIYELVRGELSLKLRGAAARLFFSDSFDFSDLGPRIAKGIAEVLATYFRRFDGKASSLIVLGLPTPQSWFTGMLARELGLRAFARDRMTIEGALGLRLPDSELPGTPGSWLGLLSYLASVCRPDGAHFPALDRGAEQRPQEPAMLFLPDDAPTPPSYFATVSAQRPESPAQEPATAGAQSRPPLASPFSNWPSPRQTGAAWDAAALADGIGRSREAEAPAPSSPFPDEIPPQLPPALKPDPADELPPSTNWRTTEDDVVIPAGKTTAPLPDFSSRLDVPPASHPDALQGLSTPPIAPQSPPGGQTQPPTGASGKTWAAIAALNTALRPESPESSATNPLEEARNLSRTSPISKVETRAAHPGETLTPFSPVQSEEPMDPFPRSRRRDPWRYVAMASLGLVLLLVFVLFAVARSKPVRSMDSGGAQSEGAPTVVPMRVEEGVGKVLLRPVPREAKVSWNGRVLLANPGQPLQLPAGTHELVLEHPGFERKVVPVTVQSDSLTSLGLVELVRATSSLDIRSNVPGVRVAIVPIQAPGGILGIPDLTGEVPNVFNGLAVGRYRVTASVRGWASQRVEVDVEAGKAAELSLQWSAGSLKIVSEPSGAEVHVNDRLVGKTPIERLELPPGAARVVLRLEGHRIQEERVEVAEGQSVTVSARMQAVGRVYSLVELDRRPSPVSVPGPAPAPEGEDGRGRVVVSLIVEVSGTTRSHQIVEASSPDVAQRVLSVAPSWRFRPGEKGGVPVESRIEVPITVNR